MGQRVVSPFASCDPDHVAAGGPAQLQLTDLGFAQLGASPPRDGPSERAGLDCASARVTAGDPASPRVSTGDPASPTGTNSKGQHCTFTYRKHYFVHSFHRVTGKTSLQDLDTVVDAMADMYADAA